ncbi:MAG TPA: hypothetical protein VH414_23060 [Lichenihabitans sp.]|jgi:hypothetical protein|nr:hypothetical protein [Lichenihabitans sp.]
MEKDKDWTEKQQELSEASRNDYWLRTLSPDRRAILGKVEYRRQCRLAKQRLKRADEACLQLRRARLKALTPSRTGPIEARH